jgi:prepilin-type processing-associated H-X9-DG protein/prepilin-type N-terminal cleavage/methylation domain-containing protein
MLTFHPAYKHRRTPDTQATASKPRPQVETDAFTLIELLVVISIIAVIVSILLPALSRSRQLSQSGVCLANLHRLAVASEMYIFEYGVFSPFRLQKNENGSTHVNMWGAAKPRWQWFFDHGVGPVVNPHGFPSPFDDGDRSDDGRGGTMMTNNYFIDPAMKDAEFSRDIRNGAYGYNYQYLGNARTDTVSSRYDNWPVNPSAFMRAQEVVLVADSRGGAEPHGGHSYTLDPPRLARSVNAQRFGPGGGAREELRHSPAEARHPRGANVSFVDGHAETLTLREIGYHVDERGRVVPDGSEANNRLWFGMGHDEPSAAARSEP